MARRTEAQTADRHDLYQRSVQSVEAEIDFVDYLYRKHRGRPATLLREDFCGTAYTSCEWARRRWRNFAVGVDLDPRALEWGIRHNLAALTPDQRSRVELHCDNVLHVEKYHPEGSRRRRGFDLILAMNFSYWCFKERATMLRYFRAVRRSLAPGGMFFLDFYGGPDALREMTERRRIAAERKSGAIATGFTYLWEQKRYDPITGDLLCYIHFRLKDGSAIRRAFRYDWRLWTIPELRDILHDAGFGRSTVYWEGDDGKGGGNGVFRPARHGEACEAYIAYIVAEA
jgi:SAM-dependent methyltransferase